MYPDDALQRFNDDILAIVRACDGSAPCPPPTADRRVAELLSINGPLWTREVTEGAEGALCPKVEALLHAVGAQRMVVGHTIQARPPLLLPVVLRTRRSCVLRRWRVVAGRRGCRYPCSDLRYSEVAGVLE